MHFLLLGINIFLNGFKNQLSIEGEYAPRKGEGVYCPFICVFMDPPVTDRPRQTST